MHNMKRLLCMMLALAMVMSFALPMAAFADEDDEHGWSYEIEYPDDSGLEDVDSGDIFATVDEARAAALAAIKPGYKVGKIETEYDDDGGEVEIDAIVDPDYKPEPTFETWTCVLVRGEESQTMGGLATEEAALEMGKSCMGDKYEYDRHEVDEVKGIVTVYGKEIKNTPAFESWT